MVQLKGEGVAFEFYGDVEEGTVTFYVGSSEYQLSEEQVTDLIADLQQQLRKSKLTWDEYRAERKIEAKGSQPDVTPEEQGEAAAEAAHSNTVD